VQIRGLLHVPLFALDAAHVDLVGAVGQIDGREAERREPVARLRDERRGNRRGAGADEVARGAPEKIRLPRRRNRLARRQGNRRRESGRVFVDVKRPIEMRNSQAFER